MGRFRSSQSQAEHAVRKISAIGKPRYQSKDGKIHSLGTARTYGEALKPVADFIAIKRLAPNGKGLASLTPEIATMFLEKQKWKVGGKQLSKYKEAMQAVLGKQLPSVASNCKVAIRSRAYTAEQINLIANAQSSKHSLATHIAANASLRAHELLTLRLQGERHASKHRTWLPSRFMGRKEFRLYTVKGKGGLVREVAISKYLSEMLEQCRLETPRLVMDRKILYEQHYDIGGGKKWSDSFTKAAKRVFGWTEGAHGVRHSYAQGRMFTLQNMGIIYGNALEIVSQEMGHFRSDITEVYLR